MLFQLFVFGISLLASQTQRVTIPNPKELQKTLMKTYIVNEIDKMLQTAGVDKETRKKDKKEIAKGVDQVYATYDNLSDDNKAKIAVLLTSTLPAIRDSTLEEREKAKSQLAYFQGLKETRKQELIQFIFENVTNTIQERDPKFVSLTPQQQIKHLANNVDMIIEHDKKTPNPVYNITQMPPQQQKPQNSTDLNGFLQENLKGVQDLMETINSTSFNWTQLNDTVNGLVTEDDKQQISQLLSNLTKEYEDQITGMEKNSSNSTESGLEGSLKNETESELKQEKNGGKEGEEVNEDDDSSQIVLYCALAVIAVITVGYIWRRRIKIQEKQHNTPYAMSEEYSNNRAG